MEKKVLYIVPHTHWDREWYMGLAKHRYRLVELMDTLIVTLESDADFTCFHLDGQVIVLEDYLSVRPEQRERLLKLIAGGRIKIGPFYILQDEFLISGEANVRNILYGMKECAKYGECEKTGYFPDAFGNISQIPQILSGFGLDSVFFGRGILPIGYANEVLGKGDDGFSELIWRGADGSEIIAVQFLNWYNNANEIPIEKSAAVKRIKEIISNAEKCARTPYLLGMNGCDHQPVQTDLSRALANARSGVDAELKIGGLGEYIKCIRPYRDRFYTYTGEITGQTGDGYFTLVNTASAKIYLKQANHVAQYLLENVAEPYSVMLKGKAADTDYLYYMWKQLMQNHPHDSICGCCCDEVSREMSVRFTNVIQSADSYISDMTDCFVSRIDTSKMGDQNLVVINSDIYGHTQVAEASIEYRDGEKIPENFCVRDSQGRVVPSKVIGITEERRFRLPKDTFRVVYDAKVVKLQFVASVQALSTRCYQVLDCKSESKTDLSSTDRECENSMLKLWFNDDGSFNILDKHSDKLFYHQNVFEDVGDIGDEYTFTQVGEPVTTLHKPAKIEKTEDTPLSVTYKIIHSLTVPVRGDKANKQRSEETCEITIESQVSVKAYASRVEMTTTVSNSAYDHRIRALFESGIHADTHFGEGQFDFVERKNKMGEKWKNASNCQRMENLMFLLDREDNGLILSGRGLNEYEVFGERNTLALTLLRGVGEIGDWFYFPTPDAQCSGSCTAEYAVGICHSDIFQTAINAAYDYARPKLRVYSTNRHAGNLPAEQSYFTILENGGAQMSALKRAESGNGDVLRIFNPLMKPVRLRFQCESACLVKLNEEFVSEIAKTDGIYELELLPKKIATIKLNEGISN